MSIKKFSESGIANRGFSGKSYTPSSSVPYVRPVDWAALPVLTEADNRFVGLHAVYEEGNFLALSAAGDYTIDWGDGVTENFAANVVAYHIYDYANVNLSSVTSRGYKTAIVSLTMQGGQTFTMLNLHQKHNMVGLSAYNSGFLDIAIAGSSLTDIRVGVVIPGDTTKSIRFYDLEIFNLVKSDLRQCEVLLYNCCSLQEVINIDTSSTSAITTAVTFQDTGDTVSAIAHGFRNGDSVLFTTITTTTGISVATRYFIVNVTSDTFQVTATYGGAAITLTLDGIGTVVYGVSMTNMFSDCYSLTSVPLFNTVNVTNMSYMFQSCYSLTSVPLFNTVNVTNMSYMFQTCYSLTSVPLFNTANVTNMTNMFQSCSSLTSVPLFNTASVTNMGVMFQTCSSLTSVPLFNTVNVTNMGSMLQICYSLTTIPLFNTASVTNMGNMFNGCYSLTQINMFPIKTALSVTGCKLSEAALTVILENLDRLASAKTFTIGANYGAVTPISLSGTTVAGSTTVTMVNTSGITVGMQVTGTGTPTTTAIACTFTDAGDLVTKTAHGLSNGDEVSFATIVTTTGILTNTIYYVVASTANTFQVAATVGGAAIALVTNGTGTMKYKATVTAINPNVSITLSRTAISNGPNTLAFRTLKTNTAMLRGWTISG